jgi:uncharacterized paraquat-inducible protein A
MNRKHIALGVALLVMAGTVWFTLPADKARPEGDPSKYRFLHCPECQRENMYSPGAAEQPCRYCEKKLVPTVDSVKQPGAAGSSPYNRMGILLLVEAFVLLALTWLLFRPRPEDQDANYLYINCDRCRQKIRYHVNQVGQAAMCRRCKHAFRYPEGDE